MKKSIFVLGLAVLGLSACSKERTCSCAEYSYDMLGTSVTVPAEDYESGEKISKADAEEWCDALQAINTIIDASATCELK